MKCSECRFLGEDFACHRGPPQAYFSSMGLKFVFPSVSLFRDWCGKGELKAYSQPATAVSKGLKRLLEKDPAAISSVQKSSLLLKTASPQKAGGKSGKLNK